MRRNGPGVPVAARRRRARDSDQSWCCERNIHQVHSARTQHERVESKSSRPGGFTRIEASSLEWNLPLAVTRLRSRCNPRLCSSESAPSVCSTSRSDSDEEANTTTHLETPPQRVIIFSTSSTKQASPSRSDGGSLRGHAGGSDRRRRRNSRACSRATSDLIRTHAEASMGRIQTGVERRWSSACAIAVSA